MASSPWPHHKCVPSANRAPWTKLGTLVLVALHWLVLEVPLVQVTALGQSMAALVRRVGGLYPQDLPLRLTWASSGAEDTGLEHNLVAQGPGSSCHCCRGAGTQPNLPAAPLPTAVTMPDTNLAYCS